MPEPRQRRAPEQRSVVKWLQAMSDDQMAYLLRTDYVTFCEAIWEYRGFHENPKLALCDTDRLMMQWMANGPGESGVFAPRGSGKTNKLTCTYPLWVWISHPNAKILIPSKGGRFATDIVSFIRDCIDNVPFLQHLKPKRRTGAKRAQKDTGAFFDIGPADPSPVRSLRATGIGGQITGGRAHIIIPDDVEDDKNALTVEARDRVEHSCAELMRLRYLPGTDRIPRKIFYVFTYHHDSDSVYMRLARKNYVFRTYPILYPKLDELHEFENVDPVLVNALQEGRRKPGDIVFFPQMTMEHVEKQRGEGELAFEMQQMGRKNASGRSRHPLKLENLIVHPCRAREAPLSLTWGTRDAQGSTQIPNLPTLGIANEKFRRPIHIHPQTMPYQVTKAWVDPAGEGEDEIAVASIGHLAGLFHIKACTGVLVRECTPPFDAPPEASNFLIALDRIVNILRDTGVDECFYEDNIDTFGSFGAALKHAIAKGSLKPGVDPLYPEGWSCRLTGVHSAQFRIATPDGTDVRGTHKSMRICTILAPLLDSHRLVIDPQVLIPDDKDVRYQLQHQIAWITREKKCLKHDDRIDALAMCLRMHQESFVVNPATKPDIMAERDRLKNWEKQQRARGLKVREPNWMRHRQGA